MTSRHRGVLGDVTPPAKRERENVVTVLVLLRRTRLRCRLPVSLAGDEQSKMRRVIRHVLTQTGTARRITQDNVHQQLEAFLAAGRVHLVLAVFEQSNGGVEGRKTADDDEDRQ